MRKEVLLMNHDSEVLLLETIVKSVNCYQVARNVRSLTGCNCDVAVKFMARHKPIIMTVLGILAVAAVGLWWISHV